MISRTGRKILLNSKGFTLIEVMAAAVILALGTVLLQGGLLRTAHLYGRYSNSLKAGIWAEDKLWDARRDILYQTPPIINSDSGNFNLDNKQFNWDLAVRPLPGKDIYAINLDIRWRESDKLVELHREIYAARPKKADGTA